MQIKEDMSITELKNDPNSNSVLYGLTLEQEIRVFEYKSIEEKCRLRQVFELEKELLEDDEQNEYNINQKLPYYD